MFSMKLFQTSVMYKITANLYTKFCIQNFSVLTTFNMQLCVILNNMYHIRKTLKEMPVVLELGSYYSWLEEEAKLGEKVISS